jgi:hypothetical protein
LGYTEKARLIREHAGYSQVAFEVAFDILRKDRGGKRGMTTDAEQDTLRAAVVFAAAGLDAVVKQLIRDALPPLLEKDSKVLEGLQEFVASQLQGKIADSGTTFPTRFLSRLLTAKSQRSELIEQYIQERTGSSLQSTDELYRAAAALGVDPRLVGIDKGVLKPIFTVRNKIIHELDIDLEGKRRKRNIRGRDEMFGFAEKLLAVADGLIKQVESKLGLST